MSVAKVTSAPTSRMSDLDSSLSSLFDNQSKGLARAFGGGGLLGLRGAVPKLPSFRVSSLASGKTIYELNSKLTYFGAEFEGNVEFLT